MKTDKTIMRGVLNIIGAHNYSKQSRAENDFYTTDPKSVERFLDCYEIMPKVVWECACGTGNISRVLEASGKKVISTDIVDRGFGQVKDFFSASKLPEGCKCIFTNPPYNAATEFVTHALRLIEGDNAGVVVMLLKTQFLETKKRYEKIFKDNPPQYMFQFVRRVSCFRNDVPSNEGSAMPFAWFVWDNAEKNRRMLHAEEDTTRIKWI